MFDIGIIEMFIEMFVIAVLAIIIIGPKDLPKLLRSIGRFVSKVRSVGQEFQTSIKQMADEVELEEVTRMVNKISPNDFVATSDIEPSTAEQNMGSDKKQDPA
jgi:sec-independent protein translocase protein TatB